MESVNQRAAQRHAASGKLSSFSCQQRNHCQDSIFEAHAVILENIFDTYGYPGYDLVGKEGSNNYWRMVQHCNKHPGFQMKVLKSMKKQVEMRNADPKNYAFLLDRLNLNIGKKQIYGTQVATIQITTKHTPKR